MNVIIANKYKDELSSLDIDVIKRLDGEFSIDTIIDTFANFYFNRMILDITAIKDSLNIAVIQKLSASLDASKIILFLSDDPRINNAYLSKIISLGIYNFTKDITGVTYLMENPNSYRDVAQYHDLAMNDERTLKQSKIGAGFAPNMQNANASNMVQQQATQPFNAFMGPSFNGGGEQPFNQGNATPNYNNQAAAPTGNYNPAMAGGYTGAFDNSTIGSNTKVIGFKDLTEDAGATTLIYMLKKNLFNRKVLAVEINNNDFSYFGDNELMSVSANNFSNVKMKFNQFDIVLIDLNNSNFGADGTCNEVIYLLEPSTIKLNTLMRRDRQALEKIKDQKIVLNKSLLTMNDVKEFEYEARVKMFYNIPPLDERKDTQMVLDSFLEKLGIYNNGSGSNGGLFSIFKK